MSESGEKRTAHAAFAAFARTFARSPQSRDGSKPRIVHEDELLQQKINLREADFTAEVIASYNKYVNPYRTFGKNSRQAEAIDADEKDLVKAYTLFKAVTEANASIGDARTFVTLETVHSPLTGRDIYTSGGEFIYLQCWLLYSQNVRDYVPELFSTEENRQTVWHLRFVPFKAMQFSFQDREVLAAIEAACHPQ